MAIEAHLVELERKHKSLESELHEALIHLSTDDLQIETTEIDGEGPDRAVEALHRRHAPLAGQSSTEVIAGNERVGAHSGIDEILLPVATREIAPHMSIRRRVCRHDARWPAMMSVQAIQFRTD